MGINVLLIAPNWIGDAVMTAPMVQVLHEMAAFSGNTIQLHVLAPASTAPVYRHMPGVYKVVQAPFSSGRLQLCSRLKLARQFRVLGFHAALVLPNSLKSAVLPWLAGIPLRVGYAAECRGLLLTHHVPKPINKPPMVLWYGHLANLLANALGWAGAPGFAEFSKWALHARAHPAVHTAMQHQAFHAASMKPTHLPRLECEHNEVLKVCQEFGLPKLFLAIAPGAEYGPAKRWPEHHVARFVEGYLEAKLDHDVVVLGGPKDRALALSIQQQVSPQLPNKLRMRVHVLAGKTSLDEAMAVLRAATGLVCNDSGLMHLACALGTPVHAVFGSSSPSHTPPLAVDATVHYLKLPCSPCFQRVCPLGHTRCLNDITPQVVLQGVLHPIHAIQPHNISDDAS